MTRRIGFALFAFICASAATAQTYPAKPIRMVVPLAPGGSVDTMARVLAQKMSETLGQQVFVDNRGGASGNIGTEHVVRSAPDGYTIMTVSMTLVVNQFLFPKLSYDVTRDLAPISLTWRFSIAAGAPARSPCSRVKWTSASTIR